MECIFSILNPSGTNFIVPKTIDGLKMFYIRFYFWCVAALVISDTLWVVDTRTV